MTVLAALVSGLDSSVITINKSLRRESQPAVSHLWDRPAARETGALVTTANTRTRTSYEPQHWTHEQTHITHAHVWHHLLCSKKYREFIFTADPDGWPWAVSLSGLLLSYFPSALMDSVSQRMLLFKTLCDFNCDVTACYELHLQRLQFCLLWVMNHIFTKISCGFSHLKHVVTHILQLTSNMLNN